MASFLKKRKSFSLSKPIKALPLDLRHSIRSGVNISTVTQCVEELVLNSIDANATSVSVRVNLVDFKLRVEDNGIGVCKEDLEMIGQRHCTSKCSSLQDLTQLRYFGFRGEALASIIDLSAGVELYSNSKDEIDSVPYYRKYKNGKPLGSIHLVPESKKPNHGFTVVVHGLLSNYPVRQNRIETPVELEEIKKSLEHIYLINPHLSIELRNDANGKILLNTAGVPSTSDAFKCLYLQRLGKSHTLHEVFFNFDVYVCSGWFSTSTHHSKSLQFVYVNKRFLTRNRIHRYLHDGLFELLGLNKSNPYSPKSSEKHPIFLVNIVCGFTEVDLTVDPKKTIIDFKDWNKVMKAIEGLVQVFQVELIKENKSLMNRSASKQKETHEGVGLYEKANIGAVGGNFRNANLSTREVKRAIHSRIVLRGGESRSPKFDSDIEDSPPHRNIKSFMAKRNSNRFSGKDSPSPPKVVSKKIDRFKPKEKAQVPIRRLSSFKRKIEDETSPVLGRPKLKTSKYVPDYLKRSEDYADHMLFEESHHKEPQFDSDLEVSPPKLTPDQELLTKQISRLLPDKNPCPYNPCQPQRKMDAFKNKQKPRLSLIKHQDLSPQNKIPNNFNNLENPDSPLPDPRTIHEVQEVYEEMDSHLLRITTHEPYLNSEVLHYEFVVTEIGEANIQEVLGLRKSSKKENVPNEDENQENYDSQYILSTFNRSRINSWVESTTRYLNKLPFTPTERETPPGSPVMSEISKLHISEKFVTPPPPAVPQGNPLNVPPNYNESQDLVSFSQQDNNGNNFVSNQNNDKFELDIFGNGDCSIFNNIFKTTARPFRNAFEDEAGVQINNFHSTNQNNFPIHPAPFNDLFNPVNLHPPDDSEMMESHYFNFDNSRFYRQDSAPFAATHIHCNVEIGRKDIQESVEDTNEIIDLVSPVRQGSNLGIEEVDKRMNDFANTPLPEEPNQLEDDAIWDSWKVEVTTDRQGTDWLKSSDPQGVPTYINMSTGAESYDMRNIANTRIISANEVKKFRYNWLRRYYPKGKLFWSPRNRKSSLAKDGNIELAEKGNTILGTAVQQCITGATDNLIMEKWREGCYHDEFGKKHEIHLNENNASILVSEYWERPNDPVELPILNLNAPEITFSNTSKHFFSCRISKEDLLGVKVISQLDKKFIVAKIKLTLANAIEAGTPEILVLFDQHAVHERIRLETLVNDMYMEKEGKKVICSVHIVPPFQLNLTESEVRLIDNYQNDFEDSGLSIEVAGLETVKVHTAPKCFAEKIANEVKNCRDDTMNRLIQMLIEEQVRHVIDAKGTLHQMPKTIFNVLCSQACRGAIKFGDQLSREACEELVEKLKLCKMPFQCAHGRPSIAPLFDLKSILPTEIYS